MLIFWVILTSVLFSFVVAYFLGIEKSYTVSIVLLVVFFLIIIFALNSSTTGWINSKGAPLDASCLAPNQKYPVINIAKDDKSYYVIINVESAINNGDVVTKIVRIKTEDITIVKIPTDKLQIICRKTTDWTANIVLSIYNYNYQQTNIKPIGYLPALPAIPKFKN